MSDIGQTIVIILLLINQAHFVWRQRRTERRLGRLETTSDQDGQVLALLERKAGVYITERKGRLD